MNAKPIILLLAIVSVGGMGITSQAFADNHMILEEQGVPLQFSTDSDTYDHSSVISIDGTVSNANRDSDVTFVVSGPMGIVQVDQITVSDNGSFSTTINTANAMMKYDGEYKIRAIYGTQDISHVVYVNLVGGDEVDSMAGYVHEEDVLDLRAEVDYSISGGDVHGITANTNGNSLVIVIQDAEDGGELTITLPSDVITPFNDGTFFVLVNDEESDDASQDGNTITVPFDADAATVEIIGTHVVPEFGTIAAIILAVAITSIIVLSAKTRLNIMPKL
jgi:predicted secreted protein with PEFG-CTERM motif